MAQTPYSPGSICKPLIFPSTVSPAGVVGPDPITSPPVLSDPMWIVLYRLDCRRSLVSVFSLLTARAASQVEVFLMCLQGTVEIHIHVFSHLDLSVFNIFRLHLYTGSYTDLFMLIVLWKYHLFSQLFSKAGYSAQYSPLNTLLSNVLFLPFYKK